MTSYEFSTLKCQYSDHEGHQEMAKINIRYSFTINSANIISNKKSEIEPMQFKK